MKRLIQRKGLLAGLIFFVLIAAGGLVLAATGNWENPFAAFTNTTPAGGPGGGLGEGAQPPDRANNANNATSANTPPDRAAMGERPGGGEASGVTWSQFGHVLYNAWFLFAAAGVVMLLGLPVNGIRSAIRRRKKAAGSLVQASA
jgi:hypothetical protein